MVKANKQVVRGFFTEVVNEKRHDLIEKYFSKSYVAHGFPYVGLGLYSEKSYNDKIVITAVVPGSPADGKLEIGDEILMAKDDKNTWDKFQQLKNSPWGQGEIGTSVMVRVKRGEEVLDIKLMRGLVQGFEVPYDLLIEGFNRFLTREWPDVEVDIEAMVEEEDMVACLITYKGANTEFERSATWPASAFFKIEKGKIIEGWGVSDSLSQLNQLGYDVKPPKNGG